MSSDLSLERSPGSTSTDDEAMVDVETNSLHLELAPFGLEHMHDYEPGGHHPVHLGDVYGAGGRYRVIHKLGHGGFATILIAEVSSDDDCSELRVNQLKAARDYDTPEGDGGEFICLPLDQFLIRGPNGDHIAFVYPVLGPNIALGLFHASEDPDKDLRRLGLEVVNAVKFLHSQGICHGDLTPSNILHRISGLNGLSEDEVLQILGSPVLNPVLNTANEPHHTFTAPEYLVYPVRWCDVDTQFITQESCVIDFGESFDVSKPPADLGIPGPYRSPELILDKQAGFGSDLWALGCTLFEIRTGRKLFVTFDDDDDEYLQASVQVLGKLPEPWWSTNWEGRRRMYKDEVDEQGRAIAALESTYQGHKDPALTITIHPSVVVDARSLQNCLAPGLWHMSDRRPGADRHREISQTEKELLADLLGKLLQHKPEDRL